MRCDGLNHVGNKQGKDGNNSYLSPVTWVLYLGVDVLSLILMSQQSRNQLLEQSVFSIAFQSPNAGKCLDGKKAKAESHSKWGPRLPNVGLKHTFLELELGSRRKRTHNGNSDGCLLKQLRE